MKQAGMFAILIFGYCYLIMITNLEAREHTANASEQPVWSQEK